jgi:uncharacterized protein YbjT (DUF2867 family)
MRIFVAGATGATGAAFLPLATARGHELVLHVRPKTATKSPLGKDPRARVFELSDEPALESALQGCDAIVSFVGTMRGRFSEGDTYASSDVASAEQLAKGARAAGVPRFLLLSSYGAGGPGAYLAMKRECERIVEKSGTSWTIFRPSSLVTAPGDPVGEHGKRSAPPGAGLFSVVRKIPGLEGWTDDVRPIPLPVLANAFLRVLDEPQPSKILGGRDLWKLAALAASD